MDARRERELRLLPGMGQYLTLTIVLLASLAPNPAAAVDTAAARAGLAPVARGSAGLEPVCLGGLVVGPGTDAVALVTVPVPGCLGTLPAKPREVPPAGGPTPRRHPVRGP